MLGASRVFRLSSACVALPEHLPERRRQPPTITAVGLAIVVRSACISRCSAHADARVAPGRILVCHAAPSAAMSGLVDGRPGRRLWEQSHFWATSLRYQRGIKGAQAV